MKIFVTGGAGFIGSILIKHIIENSNDEVINLDKLTYAGNLESLSEVNLNNRYIFENVDICDEKKLLKLFNKYKPNAVMHLAAESHVDRSIDGPAEFIKTNIIGTYKLLEASLNYWEKLNESDKEKFRFHHISTDEVFGDLSIDSSPFNEHSSYQPSSPYSATKASSDHLVRAWHRTYKLPTIITNCSNNYGPNQFPEKLIPLTIINALNNKELPIFGDGLQIRDWLYVEDHACALYLLLRKGNVGESYNIGGNNEKTNLDVVESICNLLDELVPNMPRNLASYKNLITHIPDRPGHDRRYAIDNTKIENELGWLPKESFESGIRKTVLWYLKNEDWYSRVLDGN